MFATVRQYTVESGRVDEVVSRAREGFLPLISRAPGFVSYTVSDAGEAGLATISVFEDRAGAEESIKLAAGWVKENLATLLPDPPRVTSGEVIIRHSTREFDSGYGVMRRYQLKPGSDTKEITRRAQEGLMPSLITTPGFLSYVLFDTGQGEMVALSAFEDQASADASTRQAVEWVNANLSQFVAGPPEITTSQIKLRRTQPVHAR